MLCHKIADCSILYTYDKITLSTRLIYSSVLHTTFKPKLQSKRGKHYIFKETAMLLWKWRDFKRAQHHDSVYSYNKNQPKANYLAKEFQSNFRVFIGQPNLWKLHRSKTYSNRLKMNTCFSFRNPASWFCCIKNQPKVKFIWPKLKIVTLLLLWKWRDFKRAQHHDSVYSYIKNEPKANYLTEEF